MSYTKEVNYNKTAYSYHVINIVCLATISGDIAVRASSFNLVTQGFIYFTKVLTATPMIDKISNLIFETRNYKISYEYVCLNCNDNHL